MPRYRTVAAHIDWRGFNGDCVILPVCVRSPAVRGRNFTATLDAIAARVDKIHLVMCDTLDRYNLDDADPEMAARANADAWLTENLPLIRGRLDILSMTRWKDVQNDPSFAARLKTLSAMYEGDKETRTVIDRIAAFYLNAKAARAAESGRPFEEKRELERAAAYLVEEFAGTSVYGAWLAGIPEIYWGVYVGEPGIFNRLNTTHTVDLTLPVTLPLAISRLPQAVAGDFDPLTLRNLAA